MKFTLTLILFYAPILFAKEFTSLPATPKLVELFSSEGCSSCPPAEAQMATLVNHQGLWKTFVPVNFHVDYWNHLGWTDPYSNSEFTDRQHAYAKSWGTRTVYTPAFVINAESIGAKLDLKSIEDIGAKNPIKLTATTEQKKDHFTVKVKLQNHDPKKEYEVNLALLGNGLVSNVNAGENEGRKLTQNFAALKYQQLSYNEKFSTELKLPEKSQATKYSIAVWITEKKQLKPLQVVGGYL